MKQDKPRKGATRAADIPEDILRALSAGEMESATLAEGLAVDQRVLADAVFPDLTADVRQTISALCEHGIVKRMQGIAEALVLAMGPDAVERCRLHRSDTVRGWACFMIGVPGTTPLDARLEAIRPLADDPHFGVREWAWMAVRPHLAVALDEALSLLVPWTAASSERVRRFACEAIRPRGVWASHIAALKEAPERALGILSPLRADPAPYVQDSVANWLNDAAKDRPEWVQALCREWSAEAPSAATARICQRAQRSIKS